jgi:hypothetical protein
MGQAVLFSNERYHGVKFDLSSGTLMVAAKNSESDEKSRVLGRVAVVSPACLSMCVPSSPFSPADSVAGRNRNLRSLACAISCMFFVDSDQVGPN